MTPATQNHRFIVGGNADPVDDDLAARQAIAAAGWWTRANWPESWPLTTERAADLLADAGEFDIDAEGLIDLIDRRLLKRPAIGEADELEWSASDIIAAGGLLRTTPPTKASWLI